MSHIVTVKTQVRDLQAVAAACIRCKIAMPTHGRVKMYSGQETGHWIALKGWTYPVLISPDSGEIKYDNYGGVWGEQKELDRFIQAYAVEKAKLEARKKGYSCAEVAQADGSIRLSIQVEG